MFYESPFYCIFSSQFYSLSCLMCVLKFKNYFITLTLSLSWKRKWPPTPVPLPGKSYGWRGLVGYSPWGREELDMTEWLHFHFSLSCIGEGNGNPLQFSCLENPRDRAAWWAAIYGVAQSRIWLKCLSSSSSRTDSNMFLYMAEKYSIAYMYHSFFNHSSIMGI